MKFQKAEEWNQLNELQIKNLQSIVEDQEQLIRELYSASEALIFAVGGSTTWKYKVDCCNQLEAVIQRAREMLREKG